MTRAHICFHMSFSVLMFLSIKESVSYSSFIKKLCNHMANILKEIPFILNHCYILLVFVVYYLYKYLKYSYILYFHL